LSNDWRGSVGAPVSKLLAAGEPLLIYRVTPEDIHPLVHPVFRPYVEQVGISSLLAVPLQFKDRVIGALILSREQTGRPFTLEDQVLLQDIADRASLTIENARLFQSISEQRERLHMLSARLLEAQEIERRTIARELHDEVGQLLTGLQITLAMTSRLAPNAIQDSLGEAQKLVEQLLDLVQDLALDLRPAVLDDLGLKQALEWHFERYTHQTGIQVRFDHRGLGRRFASQIETAAFRIIQEALTNVARHARVSEAAVRIWVEDGLLGLQIEDLGAGCDVQAALSRRNSTGLSGMQEQAELLGGLFTIESAPGEGTLITVELPLSESLEGVR
jgi:signal transduction histidine kinase